MERTFQSSQNLCNGSGFTPTGIVYLPAVCCIRTVASEWQTLACLRLPLCAFDLWEKDFYRALCLFGEFSNSLTLTICSIASHGGDFYFCASSSGLLSFVLSLMPSVITHWCSVFVAVGRTVEDATYRSSYFDETFVGGINSFIAPERR